MPLPLIPLLLRVPLLAKVVGFVSSKGRLVIEYALIAAVVTLCGLAAALWANKKNTEIALLKTERRIDTLETLNGAQDATIADLRDLRARDAETLAGVLEDYKKLARTDTEARKRIADLEKSNASVRAFMRNPIPPELRCLLDGTCTLAEHADKDRAPLTPSGTPQGVPASGTDPDL